MATLMQASKQWRERPADERFTSLIDLHSHLVNVRERSAARVVSSRALTVAPSSEGDVVVRGPDGNYASLTHFAFGQLASRVSAPAGYLRTLPAEMAADCLNYGLRFERDAQDIGVLLTRMPQTAPTLRAVTGPSYGRIWNATISQALVNRFGDGVTSPFRVPGEFGKRVTVTKDNTTLFASDRDMFVFLADEDNRIEVPNRRDGKPGEMARGFFVWNSEVGAATFGVATFLFDYVCCNRIVWGAQQYKEIRLRHTASAPDRWIEEVAPAIEAYAHSSTTNIVKAIAAAKAARLDDVDAFLKARFTKPQTEAIKAAHFADEQRPIETLWDATTGITAYARSVSYQNERVDLERKAGSLLDAVTI